MEIIPMERWPRREAAAFFGAIDFPFYSVTFPVEAAGAYRRAKREGLSFFRCCVYHVTAAVNAVEPFLYKLRGDTVVRHEALSPSYTVPTDDGLFKIVNVPAIPGEDCADFCARAKRTEDGQMHMYPDAESERRDDLIYLSCVPWLEFTSLTNETSLNREDSIPRITWGKLRWEGERAAMPLSVQVNHRLIDGRHLGLLQEALAQRLK